MFTIPSFIIWYVKGNQNVVDLSRSPLENNIGMVDIELVHKFEVTIINLELIMCHFLHGLKNWETYFDKFIETVKSHSFHKEALYIICPWPFNTTI